MLINLLIVYKLLSIQPQRCYWRNLSKRDLTSVSMKKSTINDNNPLISESISLFQALEVRHDDSPQDSVSREARNRKLLRIK